MANDEREAASPETVLWTATPSPWMYGLQWPLALLLCLALVGIPWALWLWLNARCTHYTLSGQRLTWQRGVLSRRTDQTELYRIRDVALVEPWWLRLMGLGNVVIDSTDMSNPREVLWAVTAAAAVVDTLREQIEVVREQKGIRAMDVEAAL